MPEALVAGLIEVLLLLSVLGMVLTEDLLDVPGTLFVGLAAAALAVVFDDVFADETMGCKRVE